MDGLLDFEPTSERIYTLRVKLKYYNLILLSFGVHDA
jgi:hypothetical protein